MSERRNILANRRGISSSSRSTPRPSPAACRKIDPERRGKLPRPSVSAEVLRRSKSEPSLWNSGGGVAAAAEEEEEDEGAIYLPRTCTDILSPSPQSPRKCFLDYNKDAKVVVNVTVEGSPGPIRTMVKLGSNIEETIRLVINKYNEEGRTPRLDKDAAATCELHHSYFSLESLSKSDLIGDVGSRSFYLRKINSDNSQSEEDSNSTSNRPAALSLQFFPSFIDRKIKKVMRRTQKLWKFLGCIPWTG